MGAGSSGGVVGALSPHVPENWNDEEGVSVGQFADGGRLVGARSRRRRGWLSGYGRLGRLQPLADAAAVELARARGAEAEGLWRGAAAWRVVRATGAAWEPVSASGWLVADDLSARLHPRLACAALVAAIGRAGGEVVVGAAEEVGPVVWATGAAGLAALGADMGRDMGGAEKGQAILLRHAAPGSAAAFGGWAACGAACRWNGRGGVHV